MRVLVTGGSGMLGQHIKERLSYTDHTGIFVSSSDYDLTSQSQVRKMFKETTPNAVVHAAARVGGIQDNIDNPIAFLEDNTLINTNVVREAYKNGIKKLIGISSTCVYPDTLPKEYYPLKEEYLHLGPPTPTNFGYGMSKRTMGTHIELYRKKHKLDFSTIFPCNLYSEYDNFHDEKKSHFMTALLKKIKNCVDSGSNKLQLFGTGKPLRQFIHANDLANIIVESLDKKLMSDFNVAGDDTYSIKEMAEIALMTLNIDLQINFDSTKPDGQIRKDVSNEKLRELFPNFIFTTLEEGIKSVYAKM